MGTHSVYVHLLPSEFCPLSLSVEDILDEVSGLTVNSPDESLEEGSLLTLQSRGGHQEDKTCMGSGQKVGYGMQRHSFDIYTNIHRPHIQKLFRPLHIFHKLCCSLNREILMKTWSRALKPSDWAEG